MSELPKAAFSVTRLTGDDLVGQARLDEALAPVPAVSLFWRTSSLSANPTRRDIAASHRAVGCWRTLVTPDGCR